MDEGNFFLAKVSQLEAAKVESDEISDDVIMSPVSNRTRQQILKKREEQNQTPTKSSSISLEGLTLDDRTPFTPDNLEEDDPFKDPASLTAESLGPREIRNEMYPKIDDEQVVTLPLSIF